MIITMAKVGIARMQAWTLTKASRFAARQRPSSAGSFVLMPRPTNLRSQKGGDFVALAAATSEAGAGLYALTSTGVVGYMQSTARDFEKLLDLKASCTQPLDVKMIQSIVALYEDEIIIHEQRDQGRALHVISKSVPLNRIETSVMSKETVKDWYVDAESKVRCIGWACV